MKKNPNLHGVIYKEETTMTHDPTITASIPDKEHERPGTIEEVERMGF